MSTPLCLLVCDYFKEEAERAVEALDGVTVAVYPADCDRPRQLRQLEEALARCPEGSAALVIGSTCLSHVTADPAFRGRCDFHLLDHSQALLLGEDRLQPLIDEGAHLVTPGMLRCWRRVADGWGFEEEQAREFFAQSVSRMVLLDTGLDAEAPTRLAELADYVGRPAERIEVGLGHLRLYLKNLVLERRLTDAVAARRDTERRLGEYAMIYDLIGRMTELSEEPGVVDNILELFTMLCAPMHSLYLPWSDDGPGEAVRPCGGAADDAREALEAMLRGGGEGEPFGEDGLLLAIRREGRPLGGLALTGLAIPEHRERYLEMARAIVPVLALAIVNARAYGEIRRLNDTLHEKVVSLDALNRELDAFAYSVSHDLRAPLRVIEGYSRILLEEYGRGFEGKPLHYLERVRANGVRMGELIDAILRLSRATRGELNREPVDLSALAHEVVESLREKEPERVVEVSITDGLHAEADPKLARVVLDNLLGNAWKYTGKAASPRIELGREGSEFFVRDNGAGFDPAYADKLFQPFQRLHGDGEFEGIGIGLSTVQRICRRHGGTLRAEGRPGEGAVFYFTLEEVTP